MSSAAPLQNAALKSQPSGGSIHAGLLLQRKCACGSPTASLTGECADCKSKKHLQTKLAIGASHDPLELEAERVADHVMTAPADISMGHTRPRIQRATGQSNVPAATAPASVDRVLASSGSALGRGLRQDMELRFGHDFSQVRVHSDAAADQSTRDVDALAYTAGHHIVFGSGQFAPQSHEGRRLIAHELTHVVQQGNVHIGYLQRAINPACAAPLARNKTNPVCKPPPSAQNVGNATHKKIQLDFATSPDQLKELPVPGSGNVCSESKIEPLFARGRADLVKVLSRSATTVDVQIAEIKPLNFDGISLGPSQVKCYQDHLKDAGSLCEPMGALSPKKLKEAKANPTTKDAVAMCSSLGAIGKTVTVNDNGLSLPPQTFNLFGRPMSAMSCFDGVVCYSCLDPEQESKERNLDEVIASPGSEAAAGFVTGFLAGAQRTVPAQTWTTLSSTLTQPANLAKFTAGQFVGRPLGAIASLEDLVGGIASLLKLGLELGPIGTIAGELNALRKGAESPTLRRARVAKDVVEGLRQFGVELNANPNLLFESGEDIGNLCGEEAGRRFLAEFVAADPFAMGVIVGKVQGYIAAEVAMLLIGAEEFAAAGKAVSAVAHTAKVSRFGLKILELVEKNAALMRVLKALRGTSKMPVVPQAAEEAAKAAKAIDEAKEAAKLKKAIDEAEKARLRKLVETQRTAERARVAEDAEEEAANSGRQMKAVWP